MVSLCRILQTADFPLSPFDAYWLGFINEVIGTDLPCERYLMEADPSQSLRAT